MVTKSDKFVMPANPFIQEFYAVNDGKLFYIVTPDSVLVDADTLLTAYEVDEYDLSDKAFKADWGDAELVRSLPDNTIFWDQFEEWEAENFKNITSMHIYLFDLLSKFVKFIRAAHNGLNRLKFVASAGSSSEDDFEPTVILDFNWNGD